MPSTAKHMQLCFLLKCVTLWEKVCMKQMQGKLFTEKTTSILWMRVGLRVFKMAHFFFGYTVVNIGGTANFENINENWNESQRRFIGNLIGIRQFRKR